MGSVLESAAQNMSALLGIITAVLFVAAAYLVITLDRGREASPHKDDTQVGLKLVLFGFVIAGVQLVAGGATQFLGFALGGFKGGSLPVRMAMPPIAIGVAVVAVVLKLLLPRTNAATHRQPERYLLGVIALQYGVLALLGANTLLGGLFMEMPWSYTSSGLANAVVSGALAYLALTRFGAASGWVQPAPPPPPAYPPQGGYPGGPPPGYGAPQGGGGYGAPQGGGGFGAPQGGGYAPPPQQGAPGGYAPPQQQGAPGGYAPPQGGAPGGYAPPQGGYAPPQGGAPQGGAPQGGAPQGGPPGLPPPHGSGGGYPPR